MLRCQKKKSRRKIRANSCLTVLIHVGFLLALGGFGEVSAGDLIPVPEPDLARLDEDVRRQLEPGIAFFQSQGSRLEGRELGLAYGRLGTNYLAHNLLDAAEACFTNAAALDPKNPRWPYLLGYIYQQTDRPNAAVDAYRESLINSPTYWQGYIRLGQALVALERFEEAEASFEVVLDFSPDQPAALVGAGDVAMERGAFSEAIGLYRRAMRFEPEADAVFLKIAKVQRAAGDSVAADEALSKAGDREPSLKDPLLAFVAAHTQGADHYRKAGEKAITEGEFAMAIDLYEIASSIEPYNADIWLRLSELQWAAGDKQAALTSLVRLTAYDPDNAIAHYHIGNARRNLGDDAAAERHYGLALEAEPNLVEPRMQLANLLMRSGRYLEAGDHYAQVAHLVPASVDARYQLGLAWLAAGKCEWAQKALSGAVALQPEDGEMLTALIRAYSTCESVGEEERQRALEAALVLYERAPGKDTAETLAMAYAANGQYEDAVDLQTQAIFEALKQGDEAEVDWLGQNMIRYREGERAALPWSPDSDVYRLPGAANGAHTS